MLELRSSIKTLPDNEQFSLRMIDSMCIEVDLDKAQNINNLYDFLSANNILVRSMRGKSSRLEELFIRLVDNNGNA